MAEFRADVRASRPRRSFDIPKSPPGFVMDRDSSFAPGAPLDRSDELVGVFDCLAGLGWFTGPWDHDGVDAEVAEVTFDGRVPVTGDRR